jgi:hypothetical protein
MELPVVYRPVNYTSEFFSKYDIVKNTVTYLILILILI